MSPQAEKQSFARTCERVCAEQHWELLPSGVRVRLEDGRSQVVDLDVFERDGRERVRLSTTIGVVEALDRDALEGALRMNARLAQGALAIRDHALVMTHTFDIEETSASELESAIRYLGATADEYEFQYYGTDEN